LHYAYLASGNDETRQLLLLQNCAFLPMFREGAQRRGAVADSKIEDLKPVAPADSSANDSLEAIFADVSRDRMAAAGKVLGYLEADGSAKAFVDAARRLIFLKGNDAHDYKFSSAVLEDCAHVSPAFRDEFLALSVFNLCGSGDRDNGLVARTRSALA
jgi:hypothetical protein